MKRSSLLASALLLLACFPARSATIDLNVGEHMLKNGMHVLTVERHSVPVVSFALYYRAGSIDDPPGKKGMAHYCEHMLFKSTKNLEGESYAKLVGAIGGGHSNANTTTDRTCYHATIPPDRLELIVRLESERMTNLEPTREEAATELEVVKEELRQGYIDDPMGRLRRLFHENLFTVHPYGVLTIGLLDDLSTITYDDLMAFYHQFYTPANAIAVIVGDFNTTSAVALMERFFGSIPAGERNARRYPAEPEHTQERRAILELPVQQSIYYAGYQAPSGTHPDALAIELLTVALSRGGSSPLGQLSQGPDPVAMYAAAYFRGLLEPYPIIITGAPLPGISTDTLEARIDSELESIARNGLTDEQFRKARAQLEAADIYELQSSLGVATGLGESAMTGTWQDAITRADRLATVTREDVCRVAREYLRGDRRTVAILKPQPTDTSDTPNSGAAPLPGDVR